MKLNEAEFKDIQEEYTQDLGIFSEDTRMIKILKELPTHDQRIIILYAELCSVRKVARLFNCSSSLVHKKIKSIRIHFHKRLTQYDTRFTVYNDHTMFRD